MNGIHEVTGSIPVRSTILRSTPASFGSVNHANLRRGVSFGSASHAKDAAPQRRSRGGGLDRACHRAKRPPALSPRPAKPPSTVLPRLGGEHAGTPLSGRPSFAETAGIRILATVPLRFNLQGGGSKVAAVGLPWLAGYGRREAPRLRLEKCPREAPVLCWTDVRCRRASGRPQHGSLPTHRIPPTLAASRRPPVRRRAHRHPLRTLPEVRLGPRLREAAFRTVNSPRPFDQLPVRASRR